MKIHIITPIKNDMQSTFNKFDRDLFQYLTPPLLSLKIERFDGCQTGDQFHLHLELGPLKQKWIGKVIDNKCDEKECYFIDEGVELPSPLKAWKHIHRVVKLNEDHCQIEDDISYSTGNKIMDYAIYPVMYLQFKARSPAYQKYLNKKC